MVIGLPADLIQIQTWLPGAHFLWAGQAAVGLFFVLSGYVLMRAYREKAVQHFFSYLWARVCRIYPAFLVVLGLNFLGRWITESYFSQIPRAMPMFWFEPLTLQYYLEQALLIIPTSKPHLIFADWSLEWELKLSLLFPLLVILQKRGRSWILLFSLAAIWFLGVRSLIFHFALGMILARHPNLSHLTPKSTLGKATYLFACLYLFAFRYTIPIPLPGLPKTEWFWFVNAVGSSGLIILALQWPAFSKLLSIRWIQFVGKVSFSLYLIHYGILILLIAPLGNWLTPFSLSPNLHASILALCTFALSLASAQILYKHVELPFMRKRPRPLVPPGPEWAGNSMGTFSR